MKITVLVTDETKSGFELDFFQQIAETACKKAGADFEEAEISVLITTDKEVHELNKQYRNIDKSTDVLSFVMTEYGLEDGGMLGDIVISIDTAKKQAEEREISLARETAFLYIHGILHLLGFDHETSEEDEKEMFDMQEEILKDVIELKLAD